MDVVRVLWQLGAASPREVHEALSSEKAIEFSTVQTYLRRLETKGYIKGKLDGRTCVYSPRVRPSTVVRETVGDLVDRLFGGDTMPLMRHLIEDQRITAEELDELRSLIDSHEPENKHV